MYSQKTSINPSLGKSPAWREIMQFYRYLKPGLWLMGLPWIGPWLQKIAIKKGSDANWFIPAIATIPVGERIQPGEQYFLPGLIVERLLLAADGIFAMAACPCRTAFKCKNHPRDLGCLHLGPATKNIPMEVGRRLTQEEALRHLERALEEGLMPTILHIPSEAEIFQVDKTRMLSLCFCCECCCDVRLMLRTGPDRYWDLYNFRLPGLQVVVSDLCNRCGECIPACYGGEKVISLGSSRAVIHERCIGCGRCIPACPQGAISLSFDPQVDLVDALLEKVTARVQIGPGSNVVLNPDRLGEDDV
jgi:UDP-glucose 4-epimerase